MRSPKTNDEREPRIGIDKPDFRRESKENGRSIPTPGSRRPRNRLAAMGRTTASKTTSDAMHRRATTSILMNFTRTSSPAPTSPITAALIRQATSVARGGEGNSHWIVRLPGQSINSRQFVTGLYRLTRHQTFNAIGSSGGPRTSWFKVCVQRQCRPITVARNWRLVRRCCGLDAASPRTFSGVAGYPHFLSCRDAWQYYSWSFWRYRGFRQ
jgi:hypothetical protein